MGAKLKDLSHFSHKTGEKKTTCANCSWRSRPFSVSCWSQPRRPRPPARPQPARFPTLSESTTTQAPLVLRPAVSALSSHTTLLISGSTISATVASSCHPVSPQSATLTVLRSQPVVAKSAQAAFSIKIRNR